MLVLYQVFAICFNIVELLLFLHLPLNHLLSEVSELTLPLRDLPLDLQNLVASLLEVGFQRLKLQVSIL